MATLRPSGSSIAIYYVVTDQLDTPREVIRPSDNALMWNWSTGPFGVEAPNTNPQRAGTFTYDLRFPGQVAGAWGSTLQNDNRDYDPAVGRYVESDPIGLRGGINTYAYAYSDPLIWSDPQGTRPPGSAGPGIETPWPWPIPPIVIPGTPENNAWVQSAYQQIGDAINTIEQACTKEPDCVRVSFGECRNHRS